MDGNSQQLRRRLSAVLCADVVGYSAHMQHDERATHLAYRACIKNFIEPLISAHFGDMVKSTGDGFFARFDSVVAAVDCAIAIQSNISRHMQEKAIEPALQFRLGVNSGDVISEKEDIYGNDVNLAARLQEQAQSGTICITAGTYEQIKGKVTAQFEDLGDITFKNEGEPTRVFACFPEGAVLRNNKSKFKRCWRHLSEIASRRPFEIAAAGAVVTAFVISGIWGFNYSGKSSSSAHVVVEPSSAAIPTERPSIAVLALEDRARTTETRALSLGIGDTIATTLAASQRFFVVDPKSSLEFSSASPSLKEIAQQLKVRFLLLGSVNQKGQKIRVNARLVDMESGRNHWAYSVLEDIDKVFDIEDKIANDVIAALSHGPKAPTGLGARGTTRSISAYRPFLQGWQLLNRKPIPKFDAAIPYLEEAILVDSKFGNAHAALADALIYKSNYSYPYQSNNHIVLTDVALTELWSKRQKLLAKANIYLEFALKEPTAYAYRISAKLNYLKNDFDAAARDARNAYLKDPNNADSAAEYGMSLIWKGEIEAGVNEIEKAVNTNPKEKKSYGAYLGIAKFSQRQYRAALSDL
jgi:adenylate cyclase